MPVSSRALSSLAQGLVLGVLCAGALSWAQEPNAAAPPVHLTIETGDIVHPVSPMLYGLMTEEINHSYEGGLYAQLIGNSTFHGNWMGAESWRLVRHGDVHVSAAPDKSSGPSTALPTSLRLQVDKVAEGGAAGLSNSGFWGIALQPQTTYSGSFYATADSPSIGPLTARLIADDTGGTLAAVDVPLHAGAWSRYEFRLRTGALTPSTHNHLELTVAHEGTLHLQLVQLFPPDLQ